MREKLGGGGEEERVNYLPICLKSSMVVGTKRKDPLLLLMAGREAEKSFACSRGPRLIVQGNMSCPNRAARSAISSLDRISKLSSNDRNVL